MKHNCFAILGIGIAMLCCQPSPAFAQSALFAVLGGATAIDTGATIGQAEADLTTLYNQPRAAPSWRAAPGPMCGTLFEPSLAACLGALAPSPKTVETSSTDAGTRAAVDLRRDGLLFQLPRVARSPDLTERKRGIHWASLIGEEFFYIGVKTVYRLASEPKTRSNLGGPFFSDWGYILQNIQLNKWGDGGKMFANDIGHPLDGSIAAFIYRRNDDNTRNLTFDLHNSEYRKGIFKAFLVAAAVSTESEIGPLSEATIGHVGLKAEWWLRLNNGTLLGPIPEDTIGLAALSKSPYWIRGNNGTGWTDFITTPFGGVVVMMGEDAVDKYVIERLEEHIHNRYLVATIRCFLNPTRSAGNAFSFTAPWHRDTRE